MTLKTNVMMVILDHLYNQSKVNDLNTENLNLEMLISPAILNLSGRSFIDRLFSRIHYSDLSTVLLEFTQTESLNKNRSNYNIMEVPLINDAELLFSLLSTDYGKKRLLDFFAFKYLGLQYMNLVPNFSKRAKEYKNIRQTNIISTNNKESIKTYDLKGFNFTIKLSIDDHYSCLIDAIFGFGQYNYVDPELSIVVEEGDVCIDCGAYMGETSLLFSYLTGSKGKVFAYEFMPKALNVFKSNIKLNNIKNIEIVPYGLGNKNNEYYFDSKNDMAEISTRKSEDSVKIDIKNIDELVTEKNINKVDYIKMDIEGSELDALKGTVNTIKKFRPKLAIAIYHYPQHMYEIPSFINSLNLNYQFGYDQKQLDGGERILFAKAL